MTYQWKKQIKDYLDSFDLDYNEDDNKIYLFIGDITVLYTFCDIGILAATALPSGYQMNRYNESDCFKFVNLYNSTNKWPCLFIAENGCFITQYWLGLGEEDLLTYDMVKVMFAAVFKSFTDLVDSNDYLLVDAVKDVCNGRISPQNAIKRINS